MDKIDPDAKFRIPAGSKVFPRYDWSGGPPAPWEDVKETDREVVMEYDDLMLLAGHTQQPFRILHCGHACWGFKLPEPENKEQLFDAILVPIDQIMVFQSILTNPC